MMRARALSAFAVLALMSVGICVVGGAVAGAAAWLFLNAVEAREATGFLYLPIISFYALAIAIPFGTLAGLLGASVIHLLGNSRWAPQSGMAWVGTGGVAGFALGALCPFFLWANGLGMDTRMDYVAWGGIGGVSGASCGAVLGWLGARVSHTRGATMMTPRGANA